MTDRQVAVVVATYNRCSELLTTLGQLAGLPERPEVVVVDNASTDGTAAAVRRAYPEAVLVRRSTLEDVFLRLTGRSLID